jgi:hypothetical protein
MKKLELDFLRTRPRPGWAAYALAALAIAFAADVGLSYRAVRVEVAKKELYLAARGASSDEARTKSSARPVEREELEFARETVRRISMPWEGLFQALQSAQSDRVALLSIEPDAENGTVSVTAEARDYLAALTYVANLSEQKALRKVHLVRHEVKQGGGKAVTFNVSAAWREAR